MRAAAWILGLAVVAVFAIVRCGTSTRPDITSGEGAAADHAASSTAATTLREATRELVLAPAPQLDAAALIHVTAVLPSGRPAAAAIVRYQDSPNERRNRRDDAREDTEQLLAKVGRQAVTDDLGRVKIAPAAKTTLCIRCGEYYAEEFVAEGTTGLRIELQRDLCLRLQVLDDDGRPRERFAVSVTAEFQSRLDGYGWTNIDLAPTDRDGMTTLPHAQLAITLPGPDVVWWRMTLQCELDPPVSAAVSEAQFLAQRPVQLRVPTGGAIAAEIVNADGRAAWASAQLEDAVTGETRTCDLDAASTWFRQLPLGRRWVLSVESFGHEVRRTLDGPTRADEVVSTRIELPLHHIALRGRVVRPDGVPIPQAKLSFTGPHARFWHDGTETSRDGSLGDTIGDFSFGGVLPGDIAEIAGATLRIEREPYCLATTVALPTLHPGTNELGDIVVTVASDEVLLASVEIHAAGRNVTRFAHAYLCGRGQRHVNTVSSFTARRGDRIEFLGAPTDQALEIGCQVEGYLACTVPVARGEYAIIELREPSASLRLHVLWPRIPKGLCNAALIDAHGRQRGDSFASADGGHWPDLPPGRSTLRLLIDDRCVHELTVDLRAGENRWPNDGGAIDLRSCAQAFYLDIQAADGGDVEWTRWYALPRGVARVLEQLDSNELESSNGRWFVPRPDCAELAIVAGGLVPERIPAPTADTIVRLRRCTQLIVHPALDDEATTIVRVVEDGVRDPWLRALDGDHFHNEDSYHAADDPVELWCAPGTVVAVVVERGGVRGAAQRVEIGSVTKEVVAR